MIVALLLAVATVPGVVDPAPLDAAARKAAADKRYCDAAAFFARAFAASQQAKHLYNEAEAFYAADDPVKALDAYKDLLTRFPSYERADKAHQRITELGAEMAKGSMGNTCPDAPASVCGNGLIEGDEACDDGNLMEGDGCSSLCRPSTPPAPVTPVCGDGVVSGAEACDDGNNYDGDGCDSNCTETGCGNGRVTRGEQCDDGNLVDGDACSSICTLPICGDGHVDPGEECDDANDVDGDGCERDCRRSPVCGDGVVGVTEECDDGNTAGGDGCDAACHREIARATPPHEGKGAGPWLLAGAGAVAMLGGVITGGIGVVPALDYLAVRPTQTSLEDQYAQATTTPERTTLAEQAVAQRKVLQGDLDAWNGFGIIAAWAGVGLFVGGVGAGVAGFAWGVAPEDGE